MSWRTPTDKSLRNYTEYSLHFYCCQLWVFSVAACYSPLPITVWTSVLSNYLNNNSGGSGGRSQAKRDCPQEQKAASIRQGTQKKLLLFRQRKIKKKQKWHQKLPEPSSMSGSNRTGAANNTKRRKTWPIPSGVIWQSRAVNLWSIMCSLWRVPFSWIDVKRRPTEEKNCCRRERKKALCHVYFARPPQRSRETKEKKKNPNIPEIPINAPPQSHGLLRLRLHVFITINIERPLSIIRSDKPLFLLYENCHRLKERSITLSRFKSISIFVSSHGKCLTISGILSGAKTVNNVAFHILREQIQ